MYPRWIWKDWPISNPFSDNTGFLPSLLKCVEAEGPRLTPPRKSRAFASSSSQSWWQFSWGRKNNNHLFSSRAEKSSEWWLITALILFCTLSSKRHCGLSLKSPPYRITHKCFCKKTVRYIWSYAWRVQYHDTCLEIQATWLKCFSRQKPSFWQF